jgi:hypothetical protein
MPGIIGIRQALFCTKGTLSTTPTYAIPMGLGDECSLEMPEQTIKGYQDEDLPNEMNFKAGFKTYQPTVSKMAGLFLVHGIAGGVDAQFVGERYFTDTYSGVYNFEGNNFMGLDFEIVESMRTRYMQLTGEVSLPIENALALLQSSIINTPKDLNGLGLGHRGKNLADYKHPFFGTVQSPAATLLCNGEQIVDRNLTVKSEGSKLQYNRTRINWVRVILELTIDKSKSYELVEYLVKDRKAAIVLEERDSVSETETWNFGEGVLYRKHEMAVSKDDAMIKLTYEKKLPLFDFAFNTTSRTISVAQNI